MAEVFPLLTPLAFDPGHPFPFISNRSKNNNAITDPAIVRGLYRASRAGVTLDLIVRGVCSLKPGVPGVSEHIRVRSVVGRFLETRACIGSQTAGATTCTSAAPT